MRKPLPPGYLGDEISLAFTEYVTLTLGFAYQGLNSKALFDGLEVLRAHPELREVFFRDCED